MTDPISDMLNRIRNAQAVFHSTVNIPFSNLKYEIAKILEKQRFIENVEKKGKKVKRTIEITLKYLPGSEASLLRGADKRSVEGPLRHEEKSEASETRQGRPAISGLKRISKPGQRIYSGKKIKLVKGGYGIAVISTPKGLMTSKEARRKKMGGEIICEIW